MFAICFLDYADAFYQIQFALKSVEKARSTEIFEARFRKNVREKNISTTWTVLCCYHLISHQLVVTALDFRKQTAGHL